MPRTGGVFSLLSGSKGAPNTPIQSAPYNAQLDDFAQDANVARPITAGGTGATTASAARINLALVPGTDVQAFDAGLLSIAGLTTSANQMIYTTALDVYATTALTPFARTILDDGDAASAQSTLGLGTLATLSSISDANWSGADLSITNGGTGASTSAAARTNLGLGNVDNTSDADKPVSTAQQSALNGKVNDTGDTMTGRLLVSGASPAGLASTKANTLDNGVQLTVETTGATTGSVLGPKIHFHKAGVVEWAVGISNGAGNGVFAGFAGGSPTAAGNARWWFTTDGQLILTDGTITSNHTPSGDIGFSGGMAGTFGGSLSIALGNRPPPASLGAGAVGSYLFANFYNGSGGSALNPGDIVPGSQVYASGDNTYVRGAQQTGTWRCMGQTTAYTGEPGRGTTLFLRVS